MKTTFLKSLLSKSVITRSIVLGAAILVAVGGGMAIGSRSSQVTIPQETIPFANGQMVIENGAVEWTGELQSLSAESEVPSIKVPYYSTLRYNSQTDTLKVTLPNPKENSCYFVYTFTLPELGIELGSTNMIEPAMAVEQIAVDAEVPTGEHKLDILVSTYSLDDMSPLNGAVINTSLVVS